MRREGGGEVTAGVVNRGDRHASGLLDRRASRPVPRRRPPGVRTGQLVATQLAVVLVLAGAVHSSMTLAAAAFLSVVLLALAWLRLNGRWAFEWLRIGVAFAVRSHAGAPGHDLLRFVAPGVRVRPADLAGDPAAVLADAHGLTAILELGDPAGLLAQELYALPSPGALLPAAGPDHPPCRIQLLLTGVPAPALRAGSGIPATSYRQLTEGHLLGHSRALLAVRVLHAEGWSGDDLLRSLSGLVRKIRRRLGAVPARPLGEAAARRVLAELCHDDGAAPVRESWAGLRLGGLTQATFRLEVKAAGAEPLDSEDRVGTSGRLVSRVLTLPSAATTVAVTAGPHRPDGRAPLARTAGARGAGDGTPGGHGPEGADPRTARPRPDGPADITARPRPDAPADITVRLAAPDAATLDTAAEALDGLLSADGAHAHRLDGEHLDGLRATLPLGGGGSVDVPGRTTGGMVAPEVADRLELTVGAAGVMIGRNRGGEPVVARLFRPEHTRVLIIGGVPCAQLVTLRVMALGAQVVIQTARPRMWEPFVRGAAVPGGSIAVVPPGRAVEVPAGTALHPLLVVVDVGPVGADTRPGAGWQATLVVRDEFGPADVDVASRADLLVLQPLRAEEADLVGAAIGLGETAHLLTRIRPDMVGLVNRRAVRWAALAQTPFEAHLIGAPVRG